MYLKCSFRELPEISGSRDPGVWPEFTMLSKSHFPLHTKGSGHALQGSHRSPGGALSHGNTAWCMTPGSCPVDVHPLTVCPQPAVKQTLAVLPLTEVAVSLCQVDLPVLQARGRVAGENEM